MKTAVKAINRGGTVPWQNVSGSVPLSPSSPRRHRRKHNEDEKQEKGGFFVTVVHHRPPASPLPLHLAGGVSRVLSGCKADIKPRQR